jgi:hypothetical protein
MTYLDRYGKEKKHTFSGNIGTVRMVMSAYSLSFEDIRAFTVNDEPLDVAYYLSGVLSE